MINRSRHWTCGAFAAWVRQTFGGYQKPKSGTWKEWTDWEREMKKAHPKVYWFTEEFLRKLQNVVMYPSDRWDDLKAYVTNRWIDKDHYLPTGFKPGSYHAIEHRVLNGLFETFCAYVEGELAWKHIIWGEDRESQYPFTGLRRYPAFRRLLPFRCPEAGLARLEWEISLGEESPSQSESARKQLALYRWWRETRPARPDPWKVSGVDEVSGDGIHFFDPDVDEADLERLREAFARKDAIETEYDREDEEMMFELIRLRKHLVT